MEMEIESYPKIYNLGHAYLRDLLLDEVIVEEKVDGSQLSFCKTADNKVIIKSKRRILYDGLGDKMFKEACETIDGIKERLIPEVTYRGEYLQKPKHNCLAYERIPAKHIMIFDIDRPGQNYFSYEDKAECAKHLGLETVPLLYKGRVSSVSDLQALLGKESVLGGAQIEGFVIKNYQRFGVDGKALLGKFVCEAFKEKHRTAQRVMNPNKTDIQTGLVEVYRTTARWLKAIQHLKEEAAIEGSASDIGRIIKEVQQDILQEEEDAIKQHLFDWAWPFISRGVVKGLAQWYKEKLMEEQFSEEL